ncbi:DNA-binding CsgD family transcriptional regulator [Anoxybacillus voinovskiensis]|uniref:DNA-binding CsgD family transcriptional regulator n=1 Tax=Anoxybacteroides voinovskiense TaxID=230470 RepID=A0A840DV81_9BACL|nr:helix-turn-helix transcriptional regulator [Anoxybacillus voinovskiensis]MBB4073439.1 DNA-binding CsgD family transcriptional regulator [Anoxybacillus voinovskiensis]GGJ61175.1 hypothetical protein GCM10008982_07900 [Anoxybacillus voinovskiensis]
MEELLYMISDLASHLIPNKLFIITIGDKYRHIKNEKLVFEKQLSEYVSSLQSRYVKKVREGRSFLPYLFNAPFGLMVEVPFLLSETIVGVLAVCIDKEDEVKEAEVYTNTLLTVSYDKLKQLLGEQMTVSEVAEEQQMLLKHLTKRELEVLKLLVQGYSNREIAENLFISIHTVKNHITNIFQKLGVSDRSQLIAMIYKTRLYDLTDKYNN